MKGKHAVSIVVSVLIAVAALAFSAAILLSRAPKQPDEPPQPPTTEALTQTPTIAPEPTPTETEPPETTAAPEPTVTTVTLVAVGDNLIHNMVYRSGMNTDPWNYDHLYANVKDDIEAADVAIINQETIFVSDHSNISNYPAFGTPREIGDAVYAAGFDVILNATNHVMDKGVDNIFDAIDFWSDKDVTVLGIHNSEEDAATPTILEVNGIRMGLLNYTYGLNGFRLPSGREYAVDLLDNEEKLLADIAYCEENADITIGFFHMGTEYLTKPSADALRWTEKTVAAGCDLLICAHPHVLEPYEIYTAENGNQALVYYSLGNFISAQDRMDSLLGGMASLTLQKTVDGDNVTVEITEYNLIPLVTHVNYGTNYAVYRLEDYNDTLGAANVLCRVTTQRLWDRFYEIVGVPDTTETNELPEE